MSVFIIAEAGVNHNGNIKLAKKLIDAAKYAGADAIKFQTFKAENLVSKNAKKAEYQKKNTDDSTQQGMLKKLELSFSDFVELKEYCDEVGIIFISTAFDFESLDFLNSINMPLYKIPSGEITNLLYLEKVARTEKKIILSTGMSSINEIETALDVLEKNGAKDITILHCTTEYPAPLEEINLKAIKLLSKKFNKPVGYSDHSEGIIIPIAAVALGATIIEKHFTLDKNMDGPDHKASLEPDELKEMVDSIRKIELALGNEEKNPSKSERKNMMVVRKSLVALKSIKKGDVFSQDNVTVKRPGNGISPMFWYDVIGTVSKYDFEEDELIKL